MNVENFVANHKHINYCEAIIHKDGSVEYAAPSHVYALIRISGESQDEIYEKMPVSASPINWLVEYTGCIAVYTNGYIKPKKTSIEQAFSLEFLIHKKLVGNCSFV